MPTCVLVEFDSPVRLLSGIARLRALGFARLEAHTPWPVAGLEAALGLEPSKVAPRVLVAGLAGALTAYLIQWWTNAYDYPLDVGGRPPHAAPAFVLITFETTVLFAGVVAFLSAALRTRLRLWTLPSASEAFRRATIDRFFLEIGDDRLPVGLDVLRTELGRLGALQVIDIRDGSRS